MDGLAILEWFPNQGRWWSGHHQKVIEYFLQSSSPSSGVGRLGRLRWISGTGFAWGLCVCMCACYLSHEHHHTSDELTPAFEIIGQEWLLDSVFIHWVAVNWESYARKRQPSAPCVQHWSWTTLELISARGCPTRSTTCADQEPWRFLHFWKANNICFALSGSASVTTKEYKVCTQHDRLKVLESLAEKWTTTPSTADRATEAMENHNKTYNPDGEFWFADKRLVINQSW